MTLVLPEIIVNLTTTGHNDHHEALHARYNRGTPGIFDPVLDYDAAGNDTGDDSAAVQAAAYDAADAGGGTVLLGKHRCLTGIVWPDNVNFVGVGRGGSYLNFPNDLGAGQFGLSYDPASPGGGPGAGFARDFAVIGPSSLTPHLGVQDCDMDGVRATAHARLEGVSVYGFRAGFSNYWDHIFYRGCRAQSNFYNVLYPPAPGTRGNQSYSNCIFTGAWFASVAVLDDNVIDACLWENTHLGFGPYGFYRSSTTGAYPFISGSTMNAVGFEYCGNAAIFDESTGGGSGSDSLLGTTFNNCGYSGSSDTTYHRIASRDFAQAIVVRGWRNVHIFESSNPFEVPPGGASIFKANGVVNSVVVHREPFFSPGGFSTAAAQIIVPVSEGFANGFAAEFGTSRGVARTAIFTIKKGDILQHSVGAEAGRVTRMTSTGVFAGVALTDAEMGDVVLVAQPGEEAVVLCESIATAGLPVRPLAGTEYHGTTSGSGPIVGYSTSIGGGSGGLLMNVITRSP